jgi:hypothetical protein
MFAARRDGTRAERGRSVRANYEQLDEFDGTATG